MGYAVELDFDQESTDRIVALSDAIYRACGGLHLTGINALPPKLYRYQFKDHTPCNSKS